MARPRKEGLEYFPHDVDATSDEKIEILRERWKNDGYAFYFIILERIYRGKVPHFDLSNILLQASLIKKIQVSKTRFQQILNDALDLGLFNKEEYEAQNILTSQGIIRRFSMINQQRERWRKHKENPGENPRDNMEKTLVVTPQSKVKESKGNIKDLNTYAQEQTYAQEHVNLNKSQIKSSKEANKHLEEIFKNSFWPTYPKKKGKTLAFKAWMKLKPDNVLIEVILKDLNTRPSDPDWKKDGGQFIPYPATYLNGRRWEDELSTFKQPNEVYEASDISDIDDHQCIGCRGFKSAMECVDNRKHDFFKAKRKSDQKELELCSKCIDIIRDSVCEVMKIDELE